MKECVAMNKANGLFRLTAWAAFGLCFGTAQATVFDAGQALKADMLGSPVNPYTDANGGVWTFGRTTAVAGGTLTTLDKTDQYWGPTFKGFADWSALPTIDVNVGDVAVACENGLSDSNHPIAPGEIALHPQNNDQSSRYAIIRFVVPQTNVYDIAATFRDVSVVGGSGVDVHIVVNGQDLSSAVVSADGAAPAGSVPSFTANVREIHLSANDTVDFVVGPNGDYFNDGTAVFATIATHTPGQTDHISLDINGYNPENDQLPRMEMNYSGAGRIGETNDFWNRMSITHAAFTNITAPSLKLADGITNTTVSFSMNKVGGGTLNADFAPYSSNPLLNDYVYIVDGSVYRFTFSGLVPRATYDLYFYCQVGNIFTPGRFTINGTAHDSIYKWFPTSGGGDYATCLNIAADDSGTITGDFRQADPGNAGVLNGFQIVGTFPVAHPEIVNLDINGYGPSSSAQPEVSDAYSGAARVGWAGDYWNRVAVRDSTVASIAAPNLKLADGITQTTVRFSLSAGSGGLLGGDRMAPENRLNALLDDCAYIFNNTTPTNTFTLSGLVPNATYDIYFYSHGGVTYYPGRFIIGGVVHDSIDQAFSSTAGGDYALFVGVAADGNGAITGEFCRADTSIAATIDGLQIVGAFPRQHADIVSLDINGYMPNTGDAAPVAGDTYSGAAQIGAAGDYWNSITVSDYTVSTITAPYLKFTDGLYNSTVSFTLSREGGGTLGADHIFEAPLNPLLNDYVYFYGETLTFTISGLVPGTPYDLYFYCHAGVYFNPGRFTINGADYYSFDKCFPGGASGDYAVCSGITADSSGVITGTIREGIPPNPGVLNGLQIMGTIPRMPLGTVIKLH